MDEELCRRCGQCCYFVADGKRRKCKYLVVIGTKSSCRIYNEKTRLGRLLYTMKDGTPVRCAGRLDSKRIIKGVDCPFNELVVSKLQKKGLLQSSDTQ